MKAAVVPGLNRTWEVKDISLAASGLNQILIVIVTSGLWCTDVDTARSNIAAELLRTLGHELDEVIVAVGTGG